MPDSALSLLLDFDDQYRRDRQQSSAFLHRRDRRIALEQGIDEKASPTAWLSAVRERPPTEPRHDPRLKTWRRLRRVFVLAGAVLGVGAMLGLLYYDGGRRINVTLIMAVALLQLLLAVLTSAEALIGWRPWRGLFKNGLPRWWPAAEPAPMLRAVQAPLAARVAHSGGLAFAIAGLLTLLTQVLIHDLAFGWATTLQTPTAAYHDLTTALAWPWRGWLPSAVPSLDLVTQSRYFRVGRETVPNPVLLGDWWTFLAMLWLCYVVVPRLALLGLSRLQLEWRCHRLLRRHPGVADWRRRAATPWVENGDSGDTGVLPDDADDTGTPPPLSGGRVLIRWAGAGDDRLAAIWLGDRALPLQAGGSASLDQDRDTLAQARQAGGPVTVLTRGWEPPTGDLEDFLDDARHILGDTAVRLVPLAAGEPPSLAEGEALAQWRRLVARRADPSLTLADVPRPETQA